MRACARGRAGLIQTADRVGGVLDDRQAVRPRQLSKCGHVTGNAGQMDRRDQARTAHQLLQRLRQRVRRHQSVIGIHVAHDDIRTAIPCGVGGGDKGDRGHDGALARPQPQRVISQVQTGRGRVTAHGVGRLNDSRERALESGDGRSRRQIVRLEAGRDGFDIRVVNPLASVRQKAVAHSIRSLRLRIRVC